MLSRITLFTAVLAICGGLFTVGGIVVPIKDAHAGKYGDKDKKCPKPARYRTKDDKCVAAGVSRKAGIKAFKASESFATSMASYRAKAAAKKAAAKKAAAKNKAVDARRKIHAKKKAAEAAARRKKHAEMKKYEADKKKAMGNTSIEAGKK